jgi:hypothetical protein
VEKFVNSFVSIFRPLMKRAFILISFLFVTGLCKAQDTVKNVFAKRYSVNHLKSDFVFFRATLETIHPSLYRYYPKDSVDVWFDRASAQLNHPMNELEYWKILAKVIGKIGSGHTSLLFSDVAHKQYGEAIHNNLPAQFYIQNDRLFIRSSLDNALKSGSEVLAINNVSGKVILNQMRELVSGDGYSNTFKDRKIAVGFNYLYNLINGDQYQFFFVLNDGGQVKRVLAKAARIYRSNAGALSFPALPSLKFPQDMPNTAVITIPNFTYSKDYERLHARFFKEIRERKINNLVIDLRNNPGGEVPIINDLMGYVMNHNYIVAMSDESYVDGGRVDYLAKKSENNEVSLADIQNLGHTLYRNKFNIAHVEWTRMREFKGKLYLLVNEGSFSAAVMFATSVKNQRDCIIVGQQTGNNSYGSDAGVKAITLPETHIKLLLPIAWYFIVSKQKSNAGQGLIPDMQVPVPLTGSYYFNDKDPVMDAVKDNIQSATNKVN